MQLTKECNHCFRDYSLELMLVTKSGKDLCIRCYNRRHKDQALRRKIHEARLKLLPGTRLRVKGTGFKVQAIGRKVLGSSSRVQGNASSREGLGHDN